MRHKYNKILQSVTFLVLLIFSTGLVSAGFGFFGPSMPPALPPGIFCSPNGCSSIGNLDLMGYSIYHGNLYDVSLYNVSITSGSISNVILSNITVTDNSCINETYLINLIDARIALLT